MSTLSFANIGPAGAHTTGVSAIHEVTSKSAPAAFLEIEKDSTGGFNVHISTTRFTWRPDSASMQHVDGQGHAHVYLDGRKIMRIYNDWFHLNTFQFATKAGEQLLSIELVGNDHVPYTTQGLPIGAEQLIDVPADEIQPRKINLWKYLATGATGAAAALLLVSALGFIKRKKQKR